MDENFEEKKQSIENLGNKYIKCCESSQNNDCTINAFHDWINEVIVLLSLIGYTTDDADFSWIMDQDYTVDGYELYRLYRTISIKYHFLLVQFERKNTTLEKVRIIASETIANDEKKPLVFISHNSSQKQFVAALVNLLESCGFTPKNLFCSSVPGFHIGLDEDIVETLRKKFVKYDLYVIYILSTDFFQSAYCLNEMGAAWVLQSKNSIIVTPNTDEQKIEGVVDKNKTRISFKNVDQMLSVRMIELRDKLLEFAQLPKVSDIEWIRYYNNFITQMGISANVLEESGKQETKEQNSLVKDNSDDIIMTEINQLGVFTIWELKKKTGIDNSKYLKQKINSLVQAGVLIPEGSNKNKKYRLKV